MINYDFSNAKRAGEKSLRTKADKIVREAVRLGVPTSFAMDSMWEYDLELASVKYVAYAMRRAWQASRS